MNFFDWFLAAIVAYSTITAFLRGILLELFSIGGLIAGILLAIWNYGPLASVLANLFSRAIHLAPATWNIISFLLIAVGVMVLCGIAGRILRRTAHTIGLGFFDRILGAIFGVVRGCLLGVAILMAAAAFIPQSPWVSNSRLSPYFLEGVHAVSFVVPQHLQQQLLDGIVQLKHNAPDWIKLPG
jgi:membrane protein required for colicin V production